MCKSLTTSQTTTELGLGSKEFKVKNNQREEIEE
jgi:hypothetical protein